MVDSKTIHPASEEQAKAFEQLARAFNIPFETTGEKSPCDPAFVKKINRGEKAGKGVKVNTNDLWK